MKRALRGSRRRIRREKPTQVASAGIFSGDRLLPWPLPVSPWRWRSCRRGDKNPGYASVANRLFPRVLVGGAFLSGEDDVRLLFPVEQLLLKTLNAFDWWLLGD